MVNLFDYILVINWIPTIIRMLIKDRIGDVCVNMRIYADAGFTFFGEKDFKLLQKTIRGISKQDRLILDYTYYLPEEYEEVDYDGQDPSDYEIVIWDEKQQEYVAPSQKLK